MKRIFTSILVITLALCCNLAYGQDNGVDERIQPSPGMEVIKVNDVNISVPKGTRIRKEGSLLIVEDIGTYSARKFVEMGERLKKLETQQNDLSAQVERVIKLVEELQRRLLALFDKKPPQPEGAKLEAGQAK